MLAALLVLALSPMARAKDEDPFLKRVLHKKEEYKILVIDGDHPTAAVDQLMAAPKEHKIVVWQVLPEHTRASDTDRLLSWVKNGGSLWFQDSRVAANFGLQSDPLLLSDLPSREEIRKANHDVFKDTTGHYGDIKKYPGMTTLAAAPPGSTCPLLNGVDYAQVFLLKVGDNQYSAIHSSKDVTPLLKMDITTNNSPLSKKLIAGIVKCGQGLIVFKPLLWQDQYTSGRLQANLLEYSAGFGVPDPTKL
jgi:hypothetical protein